MGKETLLKTLSSNYNGHFTSEVLYSHGFTKYDISKFVKQGLLERVSRGKFLYQNTLDDEFLLVQLNNSNMIFSNETALYLHNMTGRFPTEIAVTTQSGYHLRNSELKIYYVRPEVFHLGKIKMKDPFGNEVFVYDKERTICDIIRNKNQIELQVYLEGLQSYFLDGKPDNKKLSDYAHQLGVTKKLTDIAQLYSRPYVCTKAQLKSQPQKTRNMTFKATI